MLARSRTAAVFYKFSVTILCILNFTCSKRLIRKPLQETLLIGVLLLNALFQLGVYLHIDQIYRRAASVDNESVVEVSPGIFGGLLDRSTARCFYKRLKTSLHKPRGNLLENLFSKKNVHL